MIVNGLRRIGVQPGMRLEVHSSLSSFGLVRDGAEAVVDALQTVITRDGTIIMPAFPLSRSRELNDLDHQLGIMCKKQKLAEDSTERSDMGIIADTFRVRPDVYTGAGEHRCSAWGKDAARYSEGFQHLLKDDGHALLLGVDIRSLTSMHYVEFGIPSEVWQLVFPPMNPEIPKRYPPSEWFVITSIKPPYIEGWLKVQDEALRRGYVRMATIGQSQCMLFKVRDVVGIYEKWIHDDPFDLFGLKQH